jgi:putative endopeptidase
LQLLGRGEAEANSAATAIMKFETALARASRKLEDLRDPHANYNRMKPGELTANYSKGIPWHEELAKLGINEEFVIVGQPEFFKALDAELKGTPLPVLQDYLRFHLVSNYSQYLRAPFDDEYFAFNGKVLAGQVEQRERWKRVLDAEEAAMGMVLGRVFVKEYFPERTKQRYVALVEAVRTAYSERIRKLDWMSDATKQRAQKKLAALTAKVGYPDKWKDYSALVVGRESYATNMMNGSRWSWTDEAAKLGKPVDRTEWQMTPQTYNAYYNASNNEIVLPAAVFSVPGMRDEELDDAVVYGYAGAGTIGHEITHGFDDEGRQYDEKGNLADWWTAEDARKFNAQAQAMVEQFNAYEPLPGLHINGKASLGENLADYGGVLLGLDAFEKTGQYQKGEKIGGFTPLQRYFLGYALGWQSRQREERLRVLLLSDVHAPAKWRVLGPLANVPEFHQAFGVKPGQAMYRDERQQVHVW